MVGVSASVNLPLHHKVQKFSSGTGSPGWSRKKGCKTGVCVCYSSREPLGISVTEFLSAGCPSCHPAHSVYALNEIQRYKALAPTRSVAWPHPFFIHYQSLREGALVPLRQLFDAHTILNTALWSHCDILLPPPPLLLLLLHLFNGLFFVGPPG